MSVVSSIINQKYTTRESGAQQENDGSSFAWLCGNRLGLALEVCLPSLVPRLHKLLLQGGSELKCERQLLGAMPGWGVGEGSSAWLDDP